MQPSSSSALRVLSTVDTLEELAAINTTILRDGATVYSIETARLFTLSKSSTVTPDGTNTVAGLRGGAAMLSYFETLSGL